MELELTNPVLNEVTSNEESELETSGFHLHCLLSLSHLLYLVFYK